MNRWDGIYQVLPPRGDCPRKKLSSGNCSRHAPSPNRFLEEQGRIKNQTLNLSVCHSVRARRVDSGYFMAAGYLGSGRTTRCSRRRRAVSLLASTDPDGDDHDYEADHRHTLCDRASPRAQPEMN